MGLALQHLCLSRVTTIYPVWLSIKDPAQAFLYGDTSILEDSMETMLELLPTVAPFAHAIARVGFLSLENACIQNTATAWVNMVFKAARSSPEEFRGPFFLFETPDDYPYCYYDVPRPVE